MQKFFLFLKNHDMLNSFIRLFFSIIIFLIIFFSLKKFDSLTPLIMVILIFLRYVKNLGEVKRILFGIIIAFIIALKCINIDSIFADYIALTIIVISAFIPMFTTEINDFKVIWTKTHNKKRIWYVLPITFCLASIFLIVMFFYLNKWWDLPDIVIKQPTWQRFWIVFGTASWVSYTSFFNFYKLKKDNLDILSIEGIDYLFKSMINGILGFLSLSACSYISIKILITGKNDPNRSHTLILSWIAEIFIFILFNSIFKKL